jgi:hypothetical protein
VSLVVQPLARGVVARGEIMIQSYEVQQRVLSVNKAWFVCVWETPIERLARFEYERLMNEYPDAEFILVRISSDKEILEFSSDNKRVEQNAAPDNLQRR